MRVTRMYICDSGVVQVAENGSYIDLFFGLASQIRREDQSGTYLARHPSFPVKIGFGDSPEEAEGQLRRAFCGFVEEYLENNGLESFESTLEKDGFVLSDENGSGGYDNWMENPPSQIIVYSLGFKRTYVRAFKNEVPE